MLTPRLGPLYRTTSSQRVALFRACSKSQNRIFFVKKWNDSRNICIYDCLSIQSDLTIHYS